MLAAVIAGCASTARGVVNTLTFNGTVNNSWNVPGNWGSAFFPQNGSPPGTTYNVIIGGGGAKTAITPAGNVTIDGLTVNFDDTLQLGNTGHGSGATLRLDGGGTFSNAGTILFHTLPTIQLFNAGTWTLTGGGHVLMNAASSNITGDNIAGRTLHNVDNVITGQGTVGNGGLAIINAGTIQASGGVLVVNANSFVPTINAGRMEAISGGTLSFNAHPNSPIDNANGTIFAHDNGTVTFNGTRITGGTFDSAGSGTVRTVGGTNTLANVTNEGNFSAQAGNTGIEGTLLNNGSINLAAGGFFPLGGGSCLLTGTGVTNISGTGQIGAAAGTFNISQLVRGAGSVGGTLTRLNNLATGTIEAAGGMLSILGTSIFNTGHVQSTAGGTIQINSAGFNNTGGVIHAPNDSAVLFNGSTITGGTFTTAGNGSITLGNVTTGSLSSVRNEGHLMIPAATLVVAGAFTNVGSLTLGTAASSSGWLLTGGTVTVSGGGSVHLNFNSAVGASGAATLVNADNLIRGRGALGINQIPIINNGTIQADVAGATLDVDPSDTAVGLQNNNVLRAVNGSSLLLRGSSSSTGAFNQAAGALLEASGASSIQLSSGAMINGGTLRALDTSIISVGLSGSGTLKDLTVEGRTVINGGQLNLEGNVVNNGTIETSGGGFGTGLRVPLNNTATLTGGQIILGNALSSGNMTGGGTLITNTPIRSNGGQIGQATLSVRTIAPIVAANGGTFTNVTSLSPGPGGIEYSTISVEPLATVSLAGGAPNAAITGGAISVAASGTLGTSSGARVTAGNIALDGTWSHQGGTVTFGHVSGLGKINISMFSVAGATLNSARVPEVFINQGFSTFINVLSVAPNGTPAAASRIGTLTINGPSKLDLHDNDLVVTSSPNTSTVRNMVKTARNNGAWTGAGITSTSAKNHPQHATTLAVISGAEWLGINPAAPFDGFTIAPTDSLVKYTWYGDTDLNGVVNFDDYSRTDGGFINNRGGWLNGDFDMNNLINFDDYALIDLAFNTQGGTVLRAMSFLDGGDRSDRGMGAASLRIVQQHYDQFGAAYATSFLNAVPEPASILGFSGLAASAASGRRRHRNHVAPRQ